MLNPEDITRQAVRRAAKQLTLDELAALNTAIQFGSNPTGVMGYDKISHLFTEVDQDGDPKVHSIVKDEFAQIFRESML
jgi:hypothetical protein